MNNDIKSAKYIEEALKDMMKDTLQEILENELTTQIGYNKYEYSEKLKENYKNGYSRKTVHSSAGDIFPGLKIFTMSFSTFTTVDSNPISHIPPSTI